MEKILEAYIDMFTTPTRDPLHIQVKNLIDLIPSAPLLNGMVYKCSLMENEEIKFQIQDLIQKGHIQPYSSPYGIPIMPVQKKDGTC